MYIGRDLERAPLANLAEVFDTTSTARFANEYLKKVKEPRRRQILINFRDHALAECLGDHEALMATCSKKRQSYHTYTSPEVEAFMPSNVDELFGYYKGLIDNNMYLIHTEIEKLIVGEDCIFFDSVIHQLYAGQQITDMFGVESVEPEGVYEHWGRVGLTFVYDEDGKGCAEHAYSTETLSENSIRKLDASEVPAQFYSGPRKVADWFAENPGIDWPEE